LYFYSFALLFCTFFASPASAETVNYIYDELGRLSMAVSEDGETVIYSYDEVGNLLSITTQTTSTNPPTVNSIDPDVIFVSKTYSITITGTNLFTTREVWFDNSGIIVDTFSSSDSTVTVSISVSSDASLGQTNINLETVYGSASIPVSIGKLTLTPSPATITVGGSKDITASIEGVSRDYTVTLTNENADILSVPDSITISYGSTKTFTVNTLKEGTGVIKAENAGLSVYVTESFKGDVTPTSNAVSITIDNRQVQGTANTIRVSVEISSPGASGITSSDTVSVEISSNVNGTVSSDTVSVKKQ
jgi:YD repeat-containing protein